MGSGTVAGLVCFPVKSMVKSMPGEERERLAVDERGVAGDRLWALRYEDGKLASGKLASGKNSRRFRRTPGMLEHDAAYEGQGPVVTTPDGEKPRPGDPRTGELRGAVERVERCVMTTQAQRGLPADNRILKTPTASRGMSSGVYADVVAPGTLALGARVSVL